MAGDNPSVIFAGFQQGDVLEELYSNAYLYVLPSDLEGMPLSLLEAMSCANCCLVSDIPACRETAENGALYFARGDEGSLRTALQELLDHPDAAARWRKAAAEVISKKQSWEEIAAQTLAVYRGS
jgi:glycosyltransferase involved in cell wall biosynthesis